MLASRVWVLVAAALVVPAVPACKRAKAPIDGIGPWHIGKTKKSEGVVCTPSDDMTFCSNQEEMHIAEHRASVDLYFRGHDDSSLLAEILLDLGSCRVEAVDKWLTSHLGPAGGTRGKALVWTGKAATVVALLPAPDGECRIHFLDPKDEPRLAALEKESLEKPSGSGASGAAAPPPAPAPTPAPAPPASPAPQPPPPP